MVHGDPVLAEGGQGPVPVGRENLDELLTVRQLTLLLRQLGLRLVGNEQKGLQDQERESPPDTRRVIAGFPVTKQT